MLCTRQKGGDLVSTAFESISTRQHKLRSTDYYINLVGYFLNPNYKDIQAMALNIAHPYMELA